jgi:hypothetical protein
MVAAVKTPLRTRDRIHFMKRVILVVTLGVLTLASAGAQKTPKLAALILDKDGGWLSVSGVWRPDNPTKKNELVEAVTELSCFRHGGKEFVGSEASNGDVTEWVVGCEHNLAKSG